VIAPKITLLALPALVGFAAGYSLRTPIESQRVGQSDHVHAPEVRRAIQVEREIRRAIPVDREIRRAIPVQTENAQTVWPSPQSRAPAALPPSVARSSGSTMARTTAVPRVGAPFVAENGSYYGQPNKYGMPKTVHVRGYFKKNGTYVRSHYRSRPHRY
jgi:hypothetical protein